MRRMPAFLIAGACLILMGCPPSVPPAPVDVPEDVFSLKGEVIAVRAAGSEGQAQKNVVINLDPLRKVAGSFEEALLLEYSPGAAKPVEARPAPNGNISADLIGGKTYLIYAKPTGRFRSVYGALCRINVNREAINKTDPQLVDRICQFILCTPDFHRADELFTREPGLVPLKDKLGFGDLQVGGFGPGDVCTRCTGFKGPARVFPELECGPFPAPQPLPPPPAVINMIPAALSGETNQDSEPFLAVHAANPARMAGSAFTVNPWSAGGNAPIFVSQDSGDTWTLNAIVPSVSMTGDISFATTDATNLYTGILRRPGGLLLNELFAADFAAATTMTVQASRQQVDQPFVRALRNANTDRVYVGLNDFAAPNGRTATVDVSLNGGATFASARIEARNTFGQDGPSVRPAVAPDGTVYAVFFGWRAFNGTLATSDIVVVRDDNWATGPARFQALTDPSDNQAGRLVATNRTIPWSNAPTLGQERIGSTLTIAVDPNNSGTVYVAWGDRVGTGDIYTLHVRRSTDRGVTWSGDLMAVTNATNCALAIADNGTVGFLYQQVTGTGAGARWETHLRQTRDAFTTSDDALLATVPANAPAPAFLPYIGDYNYLLAAGGEFRGIFSANNTPDRANFPLGVRYQRSANFTTRQLLDGSGGTVAVSIDPFYFRIVVKQQ